MNLFSYIVAAGLALGIAIATSVSRMHPDRYRILGHVVRLAE